jgi:hypothetical protein
VSGISGPYFYLLFPLPAKDYPSFSFPSHLSSFAYFTSTHTYFDFYLFFAFFSLDDEVMAKAKGLPQPLNPSNPRHHDVRRR